jgi:RNA polymerase sigma factor for flagellar operon FliA
LTRINRNQLVLENLGIVGYLVNDLCSRATHISRDDMASAGALALITAAEAFDPDLGVPFGAFARRRIIGAFADEMRAADWATRTVRKRIRETLGVQETLMSALGRTPDIDEIASALGVDRETAAGALADSSRTVSSLDVGLGDLLASSISTPEETVLGGERDGFVTAAVQALPEKMRYIIEQIYFEDRTVKELAEELGLTHSAVSQQRSEAMRLMRDGLAAHYVEETPQEEPHSRISPNRRHSYMARLAEYASASMITGRPGMFESRAIAS